MSDAIFSPSLLKKIEIIRAKFPAERVQSAVVMSLRAIQDDQGYLTQASMQQLADLLAVPVIAILEVAHFYSLYRHKAQGKVCVKVCLGLPCALSGSYGLLASLERSLGLRCGETSPDGQWTLLTTGCQAACVQAPVVIVNDRDLETLTDETAVVAWKQRWEDVFVQDQSEW